MSGRPREGVVRGLGTEGDGAVVLDGGAIVLVRGVLPGERVRIEEVGRGRVRRGRLLEIIEASSSRVEPSCPYAAACGGCPLMHASARLQRETKLDRVRRALSGVAGDLSIELDSPAALFRYRGRARLAWANGAIGYRADASRGVVDVARCAVLTPELDAALGLVRERLGARLAGAGEIRIGQASGRPTLALETRDPQPAALYATLADLVQGGALAGVALLAGGATAAATFGAGHEETTDADGRTLRVPLGGFGQAHAEHNRALAAAALDAAAPEGARVLELYAGHGNFTLGLAARAAAVVAVERDAAAAACLRFNLDAHGLEARVIADDSARAVAAIPRGTIDVALLDPPRDGARDAVAPLVALAPARIAYVSCDPESLGRDGRMLVAGGYRLAHVRALDMFPQTSHVEVVARFERAGVAARPSRR